MIGTGAGGLAAAAFLARKGLGVIALEQASHVGGFIAPFERDGFQFDPGLHYLGRCGQGEFVHDLLAGLGLDAGELFCELDRDGFDVFRFPGMEVRMCRGSEAYGQRLRALFPEDEEGITEVLRIGHSFEAIEDLARRAAHHELGLAGLPDVSTLKELPVVMRWARHSLGELLDAHLRSAGARAAFAAQSGDYGLPPARASAVVALMVLLHYAKGGAYFPRGGSGALRDALVRAATTSGASFRTGARVTRILVKDGRARGVELSGGERIEADVVVSDADPRITLGELVDPTHLPPWLRRKVERTWSSLGSFSIFLGMRRDLASRGMGCFNVWLYPSLDIDALYAPLYEGRLAERPFVFMSPNSLKDDTGSLAPPGCSTLELTTFVPFSLFRKWHDAPPGHRGADHDALTERIAEAMLREVEAAYPGLIGDVVVKETATPLTNHEFAAAVNGGAYGPAATPTQWGPFRFQTRTPIEGLFLAGAGVYLHGVASSLLSGREAALAAAALG